MKGLSRSHRGAFLHPPNHLFFTTPCAGNMLCIAFANFWLCPFSLWQAVPPPSSTAKNEHTFQGPNPHPLSRFHHDSCTCVESSPDFPTKLIFLFVPLPVALKCFCSSCWKTMYYTTLSLRVVYQSGSKQKYISKADDLNSCILIQRIGSIGAEGEPRGEPPEKGEGKGQWYLSPVAVSLYRVGTPGGRWPLLETSSRLLPSSHPLISCENLPMQNPAEATRTGSLQGVSPCETEQSGNNAEGISEQKKTSPGIGYTHLPNTF